MFHESKKPGIYKTNKNITAKGRIHLIWVINTIEVVNVQKIKDLELYATRCRKKEINNLKHLINLTCECLKATI